MRNAPKTRVDIGRPCDLSQADLALNAFAIISMRPKSRMQTSPSLDPVTKMTGLGISRKPSPMVLARAMAFVPMRNSLRCFGKRCDRDVH
ncbi:MAG: hypothetical protein EPN68_09900 [Rhodanobacter sp.]|nr:MAG: hypothetical protein EPN68_09900 [Rhodanobacter sp.]